METILLITVGILGLMEIHNYIKNRDLEKRAERTFYRGREKSEHLGKRDKKCK